MPPPSQISHAPVSSEIPLHRWQLPNGLVVIFQEDHRHPLAAMEAVVKTGSATEGKWMGTGVSHVLEHMLFKGTKTRAVGVIEKEIKSYGGQINAHTSHDTTGYALTVHRDHFAQSVDLLGDALQNPSFDPEELQRELEVVFRELKLRRDDPDSYVSELIWSNAYREHPYRHPIVGYEPLLKALTRQDMIDYHQTHYMPNRAALAIAGDLKVDQVRQAVDRAFGAWPRGIDPQEPSIQEPAVVSPRNIEETADLVHAQCVIVFPSVPLAHPDLFALDTLARILGEGRGSRLDLRLKETGIVHEAGAWNYTPKDAGLFAVQMRLDPPKIEQAAALAWEVLEGLRKNDVKPAELEAAKRAVIAQYLFSRQTVDAQAGDLATHEALLADADFSKHYIEAVQVVTAADVKRVAQDYLQRRRSLQLVVRPKSAAVKSNSSQPPASQAQTQLATLKNGVRVLIREDARAPIATMRVTSFGGLLYEAPEKNGVSTLAGRMLLRGTSSRSAEELTSLIRSLGGEIRAAGGRSSSGLSLSVLSRDAAIALQILGDVWYHPAFVPDEFMKEQRLLLAEIANEEDDLFQWAGRRFLRRLFPGHPYGLPVNGTQESVSKLTVKDIQEFHQSLLDPQKTVVSVYGDVRPEDVLARLDPIFGNAQQAPAPAVAPAAAAPGASSQHRLEDAWPKEEAVVLAGFRTVALDSPDFPVLEVIDAVLSGGGGRLFAEVREKNGLAYTVGSYMISGIEPGGMVLYAVTSPKAADPVVDSLLAEAQKLSSDFVPDQELQTAKQGLIGHQTINLQTNGALGMQNGLDELYGLGWQNYLRYAARIRAVTAQDIQRVAKKYLRSDACVVFVGRPAAQPAVHEHS
ncbi:MAG: insulinase family protein [Candidatus Omnitrophica bacterium]|nr:insulinase family protein [Candidatus Omnitrophota bacterium]